MEYKIYVGTLINIKRGVFKGTLKIMYCGMSNENTFVLTPYIAQGYQGFSPSIYFHADSRVVQILDIQLDVIQVTSEYIILGD